MKFVLIDRITELESPKRVVAHKALSRAEEYLADHFPRFPVLPGVLMLEALIQASAWLVRFELDFAVSLVLLKQARNVTYKSFVVPGQVLTIESTCKEFARAQSVFLATGRLDGRQIVKAHLTLRHLYLAETDPALAETDRRIQARTRSEFELLYRELPARAAVSLP